MHITSFPSILPSCSLQSRTSYIATSRKSTAFAISSSFSPKRRIGTVESLEFTLLMGLNSLQIKLALFANSVAVSPFSSKIGPDH